MAILAFGLALTSSAAAQYDFEDGALGTPLARVAPSLSGHPGVGQTLTCNPGEWWDPGFPERPVDVQTLWRVRIKDGEDGAEPYYWEDIPNATGPTYTVDWKDVSEHIECVVLSGFTSGFGGGQHHYSYYPIEIDGRETSPLLNVYVSDHGEILTCVVSEVSTVHHLITIGATTLGQSEVLAPAGREGCPEIPTPYVKRASYVRSDTATATDIDGNVFTFSVSSFHFRGGAANDIVNGHDYWNYLEGGRGDDTLRGGREADFLKGDGGKDTLSGGAGDDTLWGGTLYTSHVRGDGKDRLLGGAGDDELHGDLGNDTLFGGVGDDKLYGDYGRDALYGGAGNDKLYANDGAGGDIVNCGPGKDYAEINKGDRVKGCEARYAEAQPRSISRAGPWPSTTASS